MLTNDNVFALMPGASAVWDFDRDMVNLGVMPLFHIAGSGWDLMVMANGGHTVLHREVDPPAILRDIARYGVTHALFVPAVLNLLLATPGVEEADFSTLRTIVYGASPISDEVLVRALDIFRCDFIQAYGLTETTGAVTILAPEDHDPANPDLLRSCGEPMPGAELRIVSARPARTRPRATSVRSGSAAGRSCRLLGASPRRRRRRRRPTAGCGPATPASCGTATCTCTTGSRTWSCPGARTCTRPRSRTS